MVPTGKKAPEPSRRVVIVDRPDAPQSVLAVVRPGVAASDKDASAVTRVNTALGGSFTSRLNQESPRRARLELRRALTLLLREGAGHLLPRRPRCTPSTPATR